MRKKAPFETAAIAGLLLALYFFSNRWGVSTWILDLIFLIIMLLFWLGRSRTSARIVALGIPLALLIRHSTDGILKFILILFIVFGGVVYAHYSQDNPAPLKPKNRPSIFYFLGALVVFIILVWQAWKPLALVMLPQKRRDYLTKVTPNFSPLQEREFTPLAKQLHKHVEILASKIGDRNLYNREARDETLAYIQEQVRSTGLTPELKPYRFKGAPTVFESTPLYNVEVVLGESKSEETGIWVIGAHYDTAPGTAGADDNASGVAVLLELARLLKDRPLPREIRLVAFGTEEPPSFGTKNMGSHHYAQTLKKEGIVVQGMISLEMLGYYNEKPKSQLYPPILNWFHPDSGDFHCRC